jgi:hypothetical protein
VNWSTWTITVYALGKAGDITGSRSWPLRSPAVPDPALTQARVFLAFAAILAFFPLLVFRVPEHRGQW